MDGWKLVHLYSLQKPHIHKKKDRRPYNSTRTRITGWADSDNIWKAGKHIY